MSASDACLPPSGPPADPAAGGHEGAAPVQRPTDAAPAAAAPRAAAASRAPAATAAGQQPRGGGGLPAEEERAQAQAALSFFLNMRDAAAPPEQRAAVAELGRLVREARGSERYASLEPEQQQKLDELASMAELHEQLEERFQQAVQETEDSLQPPQPPPQPPGAEYLLARLCRAAALAPGERGPEVAAFLESARLCHEVCEVLPLAPSGRPALPSLDPAGVAQAIELGLAKLWRALYLLPFECYLASDAEPWPALHAYLGHRMTRADFSVVEAIMFAGAPQSECASRASASGGSGSGSGSDSGSGSSSSSSSSSSSVGPHGVPLGSALRLALLCCSWGRSINFTLLAARLLRAAADIAAHPGCSAAINARLAELAASQPAHHSPLLLTALQLRCACCIRLAQLDLEAPPRPEPSPANRHLPIMSMTPAEVDDELLSAARGGVAGLLELEPQAPRTLLHAAMSELLHERRASLASVEGCVQALHTARQQGARLTEVRASCVAFNRIFHLMAGRDEAGMEAGQHSVSSAAADGAASSEGSGAGSSASGSSGPARSSSKVSGAGAGATRRQQRRAAKELQQLLDAQAAGLASAPSLPLTSLEALLEAFSQAGAALKAATALLPDGWVRRATEEQKASRPLAAAVQRLVEEARRRGEAAISTGRRGMQALEPAMELAVRSGNWDHILSLMEQFAAEMHHALPIMQSAAYAHQHPGRATPTCSGCGAAAVGLRKCSRCRKAQYCSRECQTAHWRHHKAECSGSTG